MKIYNKLCLLLCIALLLTSASVSASEPTGIEAGILEEAEIEENTNALAYDTYPLTSNALAAAPEVDQIIYQDDFSDGVLNGRIEKTGGDGTLEEQNGALELTRTSTAIRGDNISDGLKFYINEDKSPCYEYLTAISFKITRRDLKEFVFEVLNGNDEAVTGLTFGTNSVNAQYKNEGGTVVDTAVYGAFPAGEELKVTYAFNRVSQTFSLWFNDGIVLENKGYKVASDNLQYFTVNLTRRNNTMVALRDLNIFRYQISDETCVAYEKDLLNFSDLTAEPQSEVTSDLDLFTVGKIGCGIAWTSTDETAISTQGTVNRSTETDKKVMLTASITKGNVTDTKSFDVTVKKLEIKEQPTVASMIYESAQSNPFSAAYVYQLPQTVGGVTAMQFTVDSMGEYGFKVLAENGEGLLEIQKQGTALMGKTPTGSYVQLKNGTPKVSVYTLLMDPITKKYSLWLGLDKIVTMSEISGGAPVFGSVSFEQKEGTGMVSAFSVFRPNVPAEDAIVLDDAYLTFDTLTYQQQNEVTADLRLRTKGRAGSDITWSSTDESVISPDGTVNSAKNATVTLTANIVNGGLTKTKQFTVNVLAREKSEKIEVKNMIFEEYFDDNESKTKWVLDKTDGDILVENEGMMIKRQTNTGTETIADLYMDENSTVYRGIYALEFTLTRSANQMVIIRQRGGGDYFAGQWNTDGTIGYFDGTGTKNSAEKFTNKTVKLTALYNTNLNSYTLFADDKIVQKDIAARYTGNGIGYLRLYLQGSGLGEVKVDNIRFYEAKLLHEDRMQNDYDALLEATLVDDSDAAYKYGMISKNLKLPKTGAYDSDITWTSSNEELISSEGVVRLSQKDGEKVTLTATITSGDYSKTKEFTFTMLKELQSESEAVQYDANCLTYDTIAAYDQGSNEIKRSLNLSDTAVYGSKIQWTSSNQAYITNSGRVTRPHWDKENVTVTMTATLTYGSSKLTKSFDFVVLKDEAWSDPQYMTDAEFFGVWDGSKWTTQGKLNYDYEGMGPVGEAVKAGDFTLAKDRLQEYYAARKPKTTISKSSRNTLWANALVDDFYHLQTAVYFQGEMWVGNEWNSYEADITTSYVSPGSIVCYGVRSWYNEASYLDIKRHDDANVNYRPRIDLTVNGAVKSYYAVDDTSVRAGQYKDTNYGEEDTMKVQTFGDFLGDDTRHVVLKFDFSDLSDSDTITSAKMVLYAKASPGYAGTKRTIILKEPTNTWSGETATWRTFPGYVYSYNGLPTKNDWVKIPDGADVEYWYQMCRLNGYSSAIASEYLATGDETYMYKMLSILNDYLHDTGNYKMTGTTSYNPNGIRGGFTRTLDACGKNGAFMGMIEIFAKSKTMTPEMFTAIMKSIWDTTNYLATYQSSSGNWRQSEFQNVMSSSIKMPEFTDAFAGKNWRRMSQNELESMLFYNNLSDGSYIEATCGYNTGAFSGYKSYKSTMLENGVAVTPEYDELLQKCAYYNLLLYTPDGRNLQYGDDQTGKRSEALFSDVAKWYNDKELEYIATFGKSGTEPKWTSRLYPLSMVTTMRADWTTDSPFLFTNVRGGGQHGHRDYNGVIVSAFGRTLLNDAGIFTYTSSDPYRQWGTSTVAHNTVLVNDTSQVATGSAGSKATGKIYDWTTNRAFDYLSQSTPANSGFEHRRTITFIKPNLWVVSDLMDPSNKQKTNNYKQLWHMPPTAGLATSEEDHTIYSTYNSGANIIVANADGDTATLGNEMGYYDQSYQQLQEAPYAYFEKSGSGSVTFDTVLMPSNNDKSAAATATKLETVPNATALKIDYTLNNSDYDGYYYMSYDNQPGQFGKYETDGQVAFVQENQQGKAIYAMIKNGTYIKDANGKDLLRSNKALDEFSVDMSGSTVNVVTAEKTDVASVSVNTGRVSKVMLNGENVPFSENNGILSEIGDGDKTSGGDKVPSDGIDKNSKPGSGGPGGGDPIGPDPVEPDEPDGPDKPDSEKGFADVEGHWAAEYANDLKKKGIANGDSDGNFRPDAQITRAELLAMVVRGMGFKESKYQDSYEDVSAGDWYANVIQTALDAGLVSADARFRPNDNITRQEMAKILAQAAQISKKFEDIEIVFADFNDKAEIAGWAADYVDYVVSIGLMQGDGGNFKPLDNATRGEAAAVISRLLK